MIWLCASVWTWSSSSTALISGTLAISSSEPELVPLGPFAEVTVDGNRVDEVVAPDRLRLIPTVAVQEQWSDDDRHFFDKLGDIHPETELYVVVAESERHGAAPIGKLVLDTAFLLSRVGDEQLHFGHLFPKPPE